MICTNDCAESRKFKPRIGAGLLSMTTTSENCVTEDADKNKTSTLLGTRGFISDLVLNAIEPGVNSSVLVFLNLVFLLLLATLAAITVFTGINIHIVFLGIVALGLMIGFNV